ncbi:MAG TPA: succinate--CoA ligase subunit alpha [Candidatus Bathyarchaeia archaeon]|nr:succinate--CoA ligase subunit alpha [Candidatus Bathyarchaeia archaeon]
MTLLVGTQTRAIVQGITGNQGSFHAKLMLQYGTQIVAGVTPGKGGATVHGVPVYDTVAAALEKTDANASIIFVPAPYAKEAGMEAIDAGLNPVVIITELVPARDGMLLMAYAKDHGATIVGPNTPGVITPGQAKLGIMPGEVFRAGGVGVASRSGTLTYEIAASLTHAGIGQSTCVGIGGDPFTGLDFVDVLKMFRDDRSTEAVVLIGEIGGSAEENAANYIKETRYPKPVAAYVAGRAAPPGKRMGHAGAIITGSEGTADAKIQRFRDVGVRVADIPSELPRLLGGEKALTLHSQ